MLPSDFFRRNVVLSFQEDAIGIRLRDVIGVDNMMWGSDYPHSDLTFPQSCKILEGVPDDEQAKPAPDHDPGIAAGNTARVYNFASLKPTARWRSNVFGEAPWDDAKSHPCRESGECRIKISRRCPP